jgi:hypothetical protein
MQNQNQRDIHEVLVILREDRQNLLMMIESLVTRGQTATRGCVILIDATGHQHPILMDFCTSFEQFTEMLKVLFKCNSIEAQLQRRYTENEQYDLAIDEGTQVTQLTSNEWPRLEVGTKVVMRIIIRQQTTSYSEVSHGCPCGAVNTPRVEPNIYSLERQAGSSIDCRKCKRRIQISHVSDSHAKRSTSTRSPGISWDRTTGIDLIRNFHILQSTEVQFSRHHDELFQCMWIGQSGLRCNSIMDAYNVSVHLREAHMNHGLDETDVLCSWNSCNHKMMMGSLVRHVREAHAAIKYHCDCGAMFQRIDGLRIHHRRACTGLQQ